MTEPEGCPYVLGETYARKRTPTFEFKPHAVGYTGGGYPRIRSRERREWTAGDGTDDVFVSIHRLAAVVWCYPEEMPLAEVTADLREKDVHHELGFPSANVPEHIEVMDHGDHSSVTRTDLRAWAKDAKREHERRQSEDYVDDDEACERCGDEAKASVAGTEFCLDCATEFARDSDARIKLH